MDVRQRKGITDQVTNKMKGKMMGKTHVWLSAGHVTHEIIRVQSRRGCGELKQKTDDSMDFIPRTSELMPIHNSPENLGKTILTTAQKTE